MGLSSSYNKTTSGSAGASSTYLYFLERKKILVNNIKERKLTLRGAPLIILYTSNYLSLKIITTIKG